MALVHPRCWIIIALSSTSAKSQEQKKTFATQQNTKKQKQKQKNFTAGGTTSTILKFLITKVWLSVWVLTAERGAGQQADHCVSCMNEHQYRLCFKKDTQDHKLWTNTASFCLLRRYIILSLIFLDFPYILWESQTFSEQRTPPLQKYSWCNHTSRSVKDNTTSLVLQIKVFCTWGWGLLCLFYFPVVCLYLKCCRRDGADWLEQEQIR